MSKKITILILGLFILSFGSVSGQTITGYLLDAQTHRAISHATVRLIPDNQTVMSDVNGNFEISSNSNSKMDSLTVSHIEYEPYAISVNKFRKSNNHIFLLPKINQLQSISVSSKNKNLRTFGNKTSKPILSIIPKIGFQIGQPKQQEGREQAVKIRIPKNIKLDRIKFVPGTQRAVCKIKFYDIKNDFPTNKIAKDIICKIDSTNYKGGWYTFDLKPYRIHLKKYKEIAIGIEYLEFEPLKHPGRGLFIAYTPSIVKSSFYKINHAEKWQKIGNMNMMLKITGSVFSKEKIEEEESQEKTDSVFLQENRLLKIF